jgi:hypothetical protein
MMAQKPHPNPKEAASQYGISVEDYLMAEAKWLDELQVVDKQIEFYEARISELHHWWECGGYDVESYITR